MVLEKSWRKTETKGSGGKTNQLVYSRIPLPSTQIKSPSAGENLNPALWEPSDTDDVWLPSEGNVLGFFFSKTVTLERELHQPTPKNGA